MAEKPDLNLVRLLDWRSLKAHLLWAYEGAVAAPPGTYSNNHLVAWRLLSGSVEITGEKTTLSARAGQWVFPPSRRDSRRFSPGARLISVHFQARWPDGRMLFEEKEPSCCSSAKFPELDTTAAVLLNAFKNGLPQSSKNFDHEKINLFTFLDLEKAMPDWLRSYVRARLKTGASLLLQGTTEARVLHGLQLLDHWPMDQPFKSENLAAQLGMSVSQLNRLFVAEIGKTPRKHFDDRRVETANELLRTSTLQIKQIAYSMGFKQPSHFSQWFYKKTRVAPMSSRRSVLRPSQSS